MKLRIISLIVACSMIFTACGTEKATKDNSVQTEQEAVSATTGGTMTIAMHKPETLNPIKNRDNTVDKVLRLVYEPLFVVDENMQVVPNLAESYTISGNTVTLKLKSGVKWDDGTEVTASDLTYTLGQLEDAELDTIYKSCAENITSYSKVDNTTVKISYSKGLGSIGYSLCFPVIPKHYYSNKNVDELKPVGNGSYKFDNYTIVKEMNLSASSTGLKGTPYITNINVKIMPDIDTEFQSLEAGVIDTAIVDINNLGSISTELSSNAVEFPTNQFEFIGFNIKNPMFSNVSVRQGFAHLIPRENIISDIYIDKMKESVTPINPDNSYTSKVGEDTYSYDANIAKTLITAGGQNSSAMTFTILVNNENSARVESAKLISNSFNSAGMHTSVEAVPFADYTQRLKDGNFTVYLGGVKLKENMDLTALANSSGAINYGGYSDANMDKLVGDCTNAMSEEGYKAALNELNKYISTQLPVIGIGFKSDMLVTNSRIKGDKKPTVNNLYGNINDWFIG